jgi:hypothetical protein
MLHRKSVCCCSLLKTYFYEFGWHILHLFGGNGVILMESNQYSLDYWQNSINISEHEVNRHGYCNSFVFDKFLYKFSFIGIKEKGATQKISMLLFLIENIFLRVWMAHFTTNHRDPHGNKMYCSHCCPFPLFLWSWIYTKTYQRQMNYN